ncbi:putative structural protein [Geobacillus phage vB_GthS_PK2.1]|nr:putative structural protein [Geobacillus phage vB_GthS_PK2.1]
MIQKWIKDQLKVAIPNLEWTYDYKTGKDHTGVVYHETPGQISRDDLEIITPSYSVYIETSDMKNAEKWAWIVYDTMNKRRQEVATIDDRSFQIIFIEVTTPPILVGIEDKKMTYSINLTATIRKI